MIDKQRLIDFLGQSCIEFFDITIHEESDFVVIETEEMSLEIDELNDIYENFGDGLTVDQGKYGFDIYIHGIND